MLTLVSGTSPARFDVTPKLRTSDPTDCQYVICNMKFSKVSALLYVICNMKFSKVSALVSRVSLLYKITIEQTFKKFYLLLAERLLAQEVANHQRVQLG
jgi:hypothetical protein